MSTYQFWASVDLRIETPLQGYLIDWNHSSKSDCLRSGRLGAEFMNYYYSWNCSHWTGQVRSSLVSSSASEYPHLYLLTTNYPNLSPVCEAGANRWIINQPLAACLPWLFQRPLRRVAVMTRFVDSSLIIVCSRFVLRKLGLGASVTCGQHWFHRHATTDSS